MGPVFNASYPGECSECGEEFEVGDLIRYSDDEEIIGQDCCGEEQSARISSWAPQQRRPTE
jgi:hypothetical protein